MQRSIAASLLLIVNFPKRNGTPAFCELNPILAHFSRLINQLHSTELGSSSIMNRSEFLGPVNFKFAEVLDQLTEQLANRSTR